MSLRPCASKNYHIVAYTVAVLKLWSLFLFPDAESYAAMAASSGGTLSIQQTKSVHHICMELSHFSTMIRIV